MTNREKYDFDCFTLSNYERLVGLAIEQDFVFSSYPEIAGQRLDVKGQTKKNQFHCPTSNLSPLTSKTILWRHDVEFSPYTALKMATIEHKLGVKATYFFQTHAETYNLFERAISDIALEIVSLGHDIGLHFDSHFWDSTHSPCSKRLNENIKIDADYFAACLGIAPTSFSFHCTDDFIKHCEDDTYGGLLNVYSKFFKTQFAYCADSTGYWRYERLEDRLRDSSITRLQVLTHDAMWNENVLSPRQRVFAAIDERAAQTKAWYDQILIDFGAKNIDDDVIR